MAAAGPGEGGSASILPPQAGFGDADSAWAGVALCTENAVERYDAKKGPDGIHRAKANLCPQRNAGCVKGTRRSASGQETAAGPGPVFSRSRGGACFRDWITPARRQASANARKVWEGRLSKFAEAALSQGLLACAVVGLAACCCRWQGPAFERPWCARSASCTPHVRPNSACSRSPWPSTLVCSPGLGGGPRCSAGRVPVADEPVDGVTCGCHSAARSQGESGRPGTTVG